MNLVKYDISFPGKTFLIGEYAVLEGAPAILINTQPRFCFSVSAQVEPAEGTAEWFHPQSPAGQWLKIHPQIAWNYHIECQDPYFGKGGFGFSSAQFNLVYLLSSFLKISEPSFLKKEFLKKEKKDLLKLWSAYRRLSFKGQKPSGADVVSQWVGEVCLFSSDPFYARSIKWPFSDLDFFLIRMNTTLNTYEHLNTLSGKSFSDLSILAEKARACISDKDREAFISILNEYSSVLKERGLVHKDTLLFLDRIKSLKEVIFAKGCGAMGEEVVAVFFDPNNAETLKALLKNENIVACSKDLTEGIKIRKTEVTGK